MFKIYVLAEDYVGYNSPFWAQHGISFLIEKDGERILFDTATYAEPILFNMDKLGIDPKSIDMIVLSHNHLDHTGGIHELVKRIGKEIPIFAHPKIFKMSFALEGGFFYVGIHPRLREEVEKLGGVWVLSEDPIEIAKGVFTTGEIRDEEKLDFERYPTISLYKIESGKLLKDSVEDEIGLAIVDNSKLLLISGCSHPGIVSMLKKAMDITGVKVLSAVIGGFHLIEASEERIRKTMATLKELGLSSVYTGHCTGFKAECLFADAFKEGFHKLHCGMIIESSQL